jgi:surface protein
MKRIFIFTFLCLLYSCNVLNLDGSKPIIEIKDGAFDPNTGLDAWGYDPLSTTHVSAWSMPDTDLDLTLPINDSSDYYYDFTIDWGDGTVQTFGPATGATLRSGGYEGAIDHTYSQPGIYTIEITGTFEGWTFLDSSPTSNDHDKLIRVHSFGDLGYNSLIYAFYNCTNLTHFAGGYTLNVTDMSWMFSSASSLTFLDLSNFDTSNVIIMQSMFSNASSLTSLDLSSFNTSNVTNMSNMFRSALGLNSLDLTNWDTSGSINYSDWLTGTTNLNKATGITCTDPDGIGNNTVNGETCN